MRIWLPHIVAKSGSDIFVSRLEKVLAARGHDVIKTRFPKSCQYLPSRIRFAKAPDAVDVTVAGTGFAHMLPPDTGKLIVVEHHCVNDPAFAPHRSWFQATYHKTLIGRFTARSVTRADCVVCVSDYTKSVLAKMYSIDHLVTILNGIETEFFCPGPESPCHSERPVFRLLYVGNLTRRKGFDLLPRIMRALGSGFELAYTNGLRTRDMFQGVPNMVGLKRPSKHQLRDAYRAANALLFPTRYEGFGYAVVEAMSCGTPVVTTDSSSLSELVDDDVTGKLCSIDDVAAYVSAVRSLAADRARTRSMGERARQVALSRFSIERMASEYERLFNDQYS